MGRRTISKRYEFSEIVVDVIHEGDGQNPIIEKGDFGLLWMTPDKGNEHEILSFEKFHNKEDLEIAEMGLKLLEKAIGRNAED